jgi:uncharacterized membrane protein
MCAVCSDNGRQAQCAACRERTGVGAFPFTRNSYTFSALFDWGWNAYKKHWLTFALALFIAGVGIFGFSIAGTLLSIPFADDMPKMIAIRVVTMVPQFVIQGAVTIGLMRMAIKAVRGEPVELKDVFSGYDRLGAWFVQMIAPAVITLPAVALIGGLVYLASLASTGAAIGAGLILGIPAFVGLFYVMLGFAFANPEIATQPEVGAIAGLTNSWKMSKGHRGNVFLVGLVVGALYMAGAMACLVGALFTMGIALCVFASLYVALRNGAEDLRT